MKNIIKDRFEQIQNGKIPQGYKKTKIGIVPNDWEVKFFKDVFKIINNNTLSRNDMNNVNGRIKNIHYGDILIRYSEILDCNNVDIPYINEGIELKNSVFLKDGDIVFADTAEDYTVGKMIEIINVNCSKIVSGLHTIPCTPKIDFGKRWLGYYCNSDKFHHQMLPLITGTKVSSISKSSIQNIEIVYPGVIEQQKIAGILSIQDRVIELKKRLIKEKKKQKKYLMQNLLTGKIRLKGFKGEWKKVKLGEICDIVKGEQINKSTLSKAGKYYVLNGGITSSGYTDVWNTYENTISIS